MSATDITTLRSGYDAFAHQDIAGVLAAFDEEIEWHVQDSVPYGGEFHGHKGVTEFFKQVYEHWQELAVDPEEFIDAGDTIAVRARITGTGAGGPITIEALHLWRMRSGKAVAFTEYTDTARELEAIGHPAAAGRRATAGRR